MTANNMHDDWWKQAVVYQVYPRSFRDANGDGLGDIAGITEQVPYLKHLGVDAIWLSPFYPSELADGGYDVIDYRNVDPRLGTLEDFDELVTALHAHGMKIVVDIVPNHTSNMHEWFQAALTAEPGSPERDRYIFREGRGEHGELPPNDWQSLFGGPAWQRVADGQWYLHIFTVEQPDLNWKNPEVHEDFKKTLRFWSRPWSGRIPHRRGAWPRQGSRQQTPRRDGRGLRVRHRQSQWEQPAVATGAEVHDIYREWNAVFNEYRPARFAVGEAWVIPEHQHLYAREGELGQVFNFEFAKANWNAAAFKVAIEDGIRSAHDAESTTTWVMSNHDVVRHASRYGLPQVPTTGYHELPNDWLLRDGTTYIEDRDLGARRARAAILMELGLPGSVYVYQGEELGLPEVANIPWNHLEDPIAFHTDHAGAQKGRDGCRVPLPWRADDEPRPADWDPLFGTGASFGFSDAPADGSAPADPHLPQPLWYKQYAADKQMADDTSMFNLYRQAMQFRQEHLTPSDDTDDITWLPGTDFNAHNAEVVAYTRPCTGEGDGTFACIVNFGPDPIDLPAGTVVLSSEPLDEPHKLSADTAVWMLLP